MIIGAPTEKPQRNVANGEADAGYGDEISNLNSADVPAHREGHVTMASPPAAEAKHYSQRAVAHYLGESSG